MAIEYTDIEREATSEFGQIGPLNEIIRYSKAMQMELRERKFSEDDEMLVAMGAIAMFNESIAKLDEPHALIFYMQRVFKPVQFSPDGMGDLRGEHQVVCHINRFVYRRIRNLPTYALLAEETELYSYDRPTPSLYRPREQLVLPVKAIDIVRRDVNLN